jgi:hypothetical protein
LATSRADVAVTAEIISSASCTASASDEHSVTFATAAFSISTDLSLSSLNIVSNAATRHPAADKSAEKMLPASPKPITPILRNLLLMIAPIRPNTITRIGRIFRALR